MPEPREVIADKILSRKDGAFLGALQVKPLGIEFATQDDDEIVYIVARKHVITNLGWNIKFAIGALFPIFLGILLPAFNIDLASFLKVEYIIITLLTYYSFIITYAVTNFTNWYYNIKIVTNKRVLDYDFNPLSSYRVAEASLDNIEDVTQKTIGLLPSFFNYGDLLIQTAGQKNEIYFEEVARPTWMRNVLVDLSNRTVSTRRDT